MSLCWQNVDPLENSPAAHTFASNASQPDIGKLTVARQGIALLLAGCRGVFSGLKGPIPAGTRLERIATTPK